MHVPSWVSLPPMQADSQVWTKPRLELVLFCFVCQVPQVTWCTARLESMVLPAPGTWWVAGDGEKREPWGKRRPAGWTPCSDFLPSRHFSSGLPRMLTKGIHIRSYFKDLLLHLKRLSQVTICDRKRHQVILGIKRATVLTPHTHY